MKTTYNVCSGRGSSNVIKTFRHKNEAEAFMSNAKNIRQFGDMRLVEQSKQKFGGQKYDN